MKRKFLIIITSFFYLNVLAQVELPTIPSTIPKNDMLTAPSVNAFQKQHFLPVNLYTGKVNVTVPIYEITLDGLKIPISLSYNSGGVKVDEVASNVGLGWSLNAGGNISKIIKGIEDDSVRAQTIGEPDDVELGQGILDMSMSSIGYHRKNAPYFYNIGSSSFIHSITYPFGNGPNSKEVSIDSSPDLYNAVAPGLNARFFLQDTNESDYNTLFTQRRYHAVFVNHSNVKLENSISRSNIEINRFGFHENGDPYEYYPTHVGDDNIMDPADMSQGLTTYHNLTKNRFFDFNTFTLNNNGFQYVFNKKDAVETWKSPISGSFIDHYNSRITTWHLEKITSPLSYQNVTFNYEQYSKSDIEHLYNYTGTRQDIYDDYYYNSQNTKYIHAAYQPEGTFFVEPAKFYHSNELLTKYPRLNRITNITWDGGTVEFHYNLNRLDYLGEKALTEVVIKNKFNAIIKRVILKYSYFNVNDGCDAPDCKRLKLDEVSFIENNNSGEEEKYLFDYNYDNPLPRRTSLQRDYLGYFNNNGETYSFMGYFGMGPSPKLYFHPNKGKYSILPFRRLDVSASREIPGYSLEPNDYSITGTLKKITYPTGGFSSFEYETHKFHFNGHDYTAGGTRIKRQKINNGQGDERVFEYSYTDSNGNSTGYINNIPAFGYPNSNTITLNESANHWLQDFTTFDKYTCGMEYTTGSYVGYSKIIEKEIGNGSTTYVYSSPNEYPNTDETNILPLYDMPNVLNKLNFLFNNSAYLSKNYTNNDIKRGKLLSKTIKSETNAIVLKNTFNYTYKLFDSYTLIHDNSVSGSIDPAHGPYKFTAETQLNIERNLVTTETSTSYLNGSPVTTTKIYSYDVNYPLIKEMKTIDSNNATLKTKLYYPHDPEVSNEPYMRNLIQANRISEPIKIESYKNNVLLSQKKYKYGWWFPNKVTIKSIASAKGNQPLEVSTTINKRDRKGNILDYYTIDNTNDHYGDNRHTALIWAYNDNYLVAKINGIRMEAIPDILINEIKTASLDNENNLLSRLSRLREFVNSVPNTEITTYTHIPLVGLSTITDPKGDMQYYFYDNFNRLQYVKDAAGNILSENQYHYRP